MQAIIEMERRFPTAKLAAWEVQFLPACGWKPVARGDYFFLQFRCEEGKARRVLAYLRGEFKTVKFAEVEQPPQAAT